MNENSISEFAIAIISEVANIRVARRDKGITRRATAAGRNRSRTNVSRFCEVANMWETLAAALVLASKAFDLVERLLDAREKKRALRGKHASRPQ